LKRAPDRIVAAVLAQPSGSRPEMRDLFYETNMKGWGPALTARRPDITMEMVDKFLTKEGFFPQGMIGERSLGLTFRHGELRPSAYLSSLGRTRRVLPVVMASYGERVITSAYLAMRPSFTACTHSSMESRTVASWIAGPLGAACLKRL
jgi:hypothetical protein